jgi:hypothetical protein
MKINPVFLNVKRIKSNENSVIKKNFSMENTTSQEIKEIK